MNKTQHSRKPGVEPEHPPTTKPEHSTLGKGDRVAWNSPQGEVRGQVTRKITAEAKVRGHKAKASEAQPQYEVQSDKTGKKAIHKPEALKKRDAR